MGGAQEQQKQSRVTPDRDPATTSTGGRAQEQQKKPQAVPTKDVRKSAAKAELEPEPKPKLELEPTPASAGKDVDTAVKEFGGVDPISGIARGAVDAVSTVFNQVVSTLANVHPYAQAALGILTSTSQLFLNQASLDKAVSDLLDTMRSVYECLVEQDKISNLDKVALAKIARAISDSAHFIINYSTIKSFWKRTGKHIFSETRTVVDGHTKTLENLMQQCRDRAARDTEVNTYRILEDLNLDGMAYVGGAGLNTTKKCLDGTRTEILQDIMNWINDPALDAPRIMWLHGQAGRGKSAIAHTIASWVKDVGGLGSCFCFARDRQAEHREEKILTTIARDLAARDQSFRRALADTLSKDHTLKTTPDVMQQWQKFISEPLSKVNEAIVGNVVVVIDALDESGPDTSREHILSLLTSPETAQLPPNFRILLTSRPLADIKRALSTAVHVKATSLDDISTQSAEHDVRLYVSAELRPHPEIGPAEVQSISQKSDGLFEWARLACRFIKPNRPGRTIMERYNEVMLPHSGGGGSLLDVMYKTILEDIVPQDGTTLARFRSVMQQIMSTSVPLQLDALDEMRSHFPPEEDRFDMIIILEFMAPLLSGVADRCSVVRPLHASFYDFLTDHTRSGVYSIGASSIHRLLAFASLHTLCHDLKFNICGLESSYLRNSEVVDLQERVDKNISLNLSYSCQYWAYHLQRTEFDLTLAILVKATVGCERLLFWLETLSLLGGLGHAASALASAMTWLQDQNGFENTLAVAQDGIKFLHNFGGVFSLSTPHLYTSALPFIPSSTMLSRMLMPKFSSLVGISVGGLKAWPVVQQVLEGHAGWVFSVGFSPDGKRIVSGSDDMTVRIWDAEKGVQIGGPLEGHTDRVCSVRFSSDGKRIVSGSSDKTVRIWDAERGVQIGGPFEGHTDQVYSVGFSSDCKRIVSGSSDKTVRVWDAERGVQIGSHLQGHTDPVRSVAFFPDGKKIVSCSKDKTVRVWDAERGVQIGDPLEGHTEGVWSIGFSSDSKRIVSGSSDKTVRIWDAERGVKIGGPLEGHTERVSSVGFSSDGKRVVSGSFDKTVRIWDAERGVQVGGPLEGCTDWASSVGFSPDGKRIVSGSPDKTVRIWDAERGVQIGGPLEGHTSWVWSVGFSCDRKRIVSGSSDKTVRIWDAERGVQIGGPLEGHMEGVSSVGFSSDGKRIVSGSSDKTVRIWDAERGVQIGGPLEGHTEEVMSVGFSSDGRRIVSGSSDKTVRIWDVERGVQIGGPLEGHTEEVMSVGFSSDCKMIVSGSSDKTVRIWDAERGVQIGDPLEGHTIGVSSVGFSSDGKRIVSGSFDKTVRIWNAERGVQIGGPLEGHASWVSSVGFSPDGKRIVSGSSDKTLRIWDAHVYEAVQSKWVSYNTEGVALTSHIIDSYSVYFSSISSEALYNSLQLLDGLLEEDKNMRHEPVKFFHDGWIRGPKGRLLLWIPPPLREPSYSIWTKIVIPKGGCIELDLSQMVHGKQWDQCFKGVVEV
ncbi:hypothetical protein PISMIDRAFT_371754 [Pisolithus microcarpus 441]|uniref:Unplaced genomic scaffold scaffold_288, whole genome shotgun sequence n=1 Tax=Pisolithus microcarpus 441 TaxID=765257 RepID=A0A0C9YAB2_9AGAM|nr:hypothetical protein PISMIDRAFT_371754 [Pisolithus microcarpus 441]